MSTINSGAPCCRVDRHVPHLNAQYFSPTAYSSAAPRPGKTVYFPPAIQIAPGKIIPNFSRPILQILESSSVWHFGHGEGTGLRVSECVIRKLFYHYQGSALGPTLFGLYAADVIPLIEDCGVSAHAYADDLQV